jgi:hypothetical protein
LGVFGKRSESPIVVCKTVYPGSIPGVASSSINRQANSIRSPHRYQCALIAMNSGTTDFERTAARAKDSTSKRHRRHPPAGPRQIANPEMMGLA